MSASPRPPEIPGHEFEAYIASGGFGDVFAYTDQQIERRVAVKVLRLTGLTPERLAEFRVEASRMANLEHDNVVRVYGFGEAADGRPYISMEYCEDHLGNRAREGGLSLLDALRYSVKVASAVDAAHAADLFHRDIKPANVLLKRNGEPALTDFGIAGGRAAGESDNRGASLRYAAREVIAAESDGDELSDVYSLGAMTYTLLAGHSPVERPGGDNSEGALVARAMEGVDGRTGRHDVPESLERVLARALKARPSSRYQSAMAYARALQTVEVELGFSPTDASFAADATRLSPVLPRDDEDEDSTRFSMPQRIDLTGGRTDSGRSEAPTARRTPKAVSGDEEQAGTGGPPRPAQEDPPSSAPHRTVIRGGGVPSETPIAEPATGASASDESGSRRLLVPVAAVTVLVLLGVGAVALSGGGDQPAAVTRDEAQAPAEDEGPPDDGFEDLLAQPSVPTDVTAARTAEGVTVDWSPDPVGEASYLVSVTAGPAEGESIATEDAGLVLDDPDPTARVCVRVLSVVGSRSSEPSTEECTQ